MSKLTELPYIPTNSIKPKKRRGNPIKRIPHHSMPKRFYQSLTREQQDLLSKINDEGLSFNKAAEAVGCSRQYLHQEYTKIRNLFLSYLYKQGKTYDEIAAIFGTNPIRIKKLVSSLIGK